MQQQINPHRQFLRGLRVLVVEDEAVVALHLHDLLERLGCEVVGPVGDLDSALSVACEEALDAALLDVKLRGPLVFPVADALAARGIPFVFVSAYVGSQAVLDEYPEVPKVRKPFSSDDVEQTLLMVLATEGNA